MSGEIATENMKIYKRSELKVHNATYSDDMLHGGSYSMECYHHTYYDSQLDGIRIALSANADSTYVSSTYAGGDGEYRLNCYRHFHFVIIIGLHGPRR